MDHFPHQFTGYCKNLAAALLRSSWKVASLQKNGTAAVGPRRAWLKPLLKSILEQFPEPPRSQTLIVFILNHELLRAAWVKYRRKTGEWLKPAASFSFPARMEPPSCPLVHAVPELNTPGELAGWLGIPIHRLDWYADLRGLNRSAPENLRHYRYRWLPKRSGNGFRLLEIPKPILKSIQKQILVDILGCIVPHDAAHGFRVGRSIVTNARRHCGRAIVIRFDLKDFFPSIPAEKIAGIFHAMGYPPKISLVLAGLCTTRLPLDIWETMPGNTQHLAHDTWLSLAHPHLPQGAPTSPVLANLCALSLDTRLAALASQCDACYTRYADDITFSGPATLAVSGLRKSVLNICSEEGFTMNPRKTCIQRQSVRQIVAGVVVNVRPNSTRESYDQLKAILTNCVRQGPVSQNRDLHRDFRLHLSGRIAHLAMLNPIRGRKLWIIFDRIEWPK